MTDQQIQIFTSQDGKAQLEVALEQDTVWLDQAQMCELFGRNQSVISRHVKNVFKEEELAQKSNMQKVHITKSDKPVTLYSLDVIISVGYRVKSQRGVQFRQWATGVLKDHLVQGYSLNQRRLAERGIEFEQAVNLLSRTLTNQGLVSTEGEATELFELVRGGGLASALATIEQGFGDELFYPNVASRAAHLLYFLVKNHALADGNKRCGSFLFLWYLRRNQHLLARSVEQLINDNTLVALALLVAESLPDQKALMIRLIEHFILLKEPGQDNRESCA
ncbi:virulence protein RhuM/Fic/DOC family protein [Alcaligenaceae bacterium]|nr:virulence protein RhuM/Fic/DOC family protein [Alcaligenaceae bacterium]